MQHGKPQFLCNIDSLDHEEKDLQKTFRHTGEFMIEYRRSKGSRTTNGSYILVSTKYMKKLDSGHHFTLYLRKQLSLKNTTILSFENRLEKMTSPEFAVSATPPGSTLLSYHGNKIYKLHNKRHLSTIRFPTER